MSRCLVLVQNSFSHNSHRFIVTRSSSVVHTSIDWRNHFSNHSNAQWSESLIFEMLRIVFEEHGRPTRFSSSSSLRPSLSPRCHSETRGRDTTGYQCTYVYKRKLSVTDFPSFARNLELALNVFGRLKFDVRRVCNVTSKKHIGIRNWEHRNRSVFGTAISAD